MENDYQYLKIIMVAMSVDSLKRVDAEKNTRESIEQVVVNIKLGEVPIY